MTLMFFLPGKVSFKGISLIPMISDLRGAIYEEGKKRRGGDGSNQSQLRHNDAIAKGPTRDKLAEEAQNQSRQNDDIALPRKAATRNGGADNQSYGLSALKSPKGGLVPDWKERGCNFNSNESRGSLVFR